MENSTAETEVVLIDDPPEGTVSEVPIQLRHPSRVFPRVPRGAIARLVIVPPGPTHTSGGYPVKRQRNQVKPAASPVREPVKRGKAAAPRRKPGRPAKVAASPPQKKATNKFLEKPQPLPKPKSSPVKTKPGASASEIKTLQKYKRKHEESDDEEEEEEEDGSEYNSEEDNSEDDTWEPENTPPKPKKFQNNTTENKWKQLSPQSKIPATSKTEKSTGPLRPGAREDEHPCPECGIVFHQKATLTKHLTIHKQQKLLAPGKREEEEEALHNNSNTKTHPLSKPLLGHNDNPAVPKSQINTAEKKPNPCTECEKSFNCPLMLQKHLKVHEQERKEQTAKAQKAKAKIDKIEKPNEKLEKAKKITIKEKTNVNNEKTNEKIEKAKPKAEVTTRNAKGKIDKTLEKLENIKEKSKIQIEKIETKEINEKFKSENTEKSNQKNGKKKIETGEKRKEKDKEADKISRCNVCGMTFTKISLLIIHRRIHTGYFSCKECGKSFSALSNLKVHQMKHKGSKSSFSCKECGKSFKIASYLQAHMRVHTLEKFRDSKKGNQKKKPSRKKL